MKVNASRSKQPQKQIFSLHVNLPPTRAKSCLSTTSANADSSGQAISSSYAVKICVLASACGILHKYFIGRFAKFLPITVYELLLEI